MALAAVCAIGVVMWHVAAVPLGNPFYGLFANLTDLKVYRAGAQTILDGEPLYVGPVLWHLEFTYPPFAALMLTPVALVAEGVAALGWWVTTFGMLACVIVLGFRSLGYRCDGRLYAFAVLLAVSATALEPVRTTIWLGQINIVLMTLIIVDLALLDLVRPGSRLKGVGVGVAAGLKLIPAFFLVYLAAIRQWRAVVTGLCVFAATVVVGFLVVPRDSWTYWTQAVAGTARVGMVDSPANQSVNGFVSQLLAYFDIRRFAHPLDGIRVYEAPWWLWMPFAAIAAVLGVWAACVAHRRGRELLAVCIIGMTAATVSPFSWGHHWVWFVPLFVVAFDVAYRGSRDRGWVVWWRWLGPIGIVTVSFTWWYHWWDSGPRLSSDHAIALGLFMMPRWPDPQWFDRLAVVFYAGCYPLVLLVTIIVTLVTGVHRSRVHRVSALDRPTEVVTPVG
ncbi:glycosyltransferase 87 family protein [Gordonia sp. LSe1-13]|uniref:Glycosyltransferase 87 family protein n=1 Tax=Gordonia sesuvii TaxID=3116777 RepID=A0ABU7MCY7_9ACTN|nr:glycosyltransferase 87 family protein [Gordonia sp. LSe1-13]